ncbi:acyl-CoA synthetase (AMP-forming)/AMP-acid ligase II [Hoeflea sp. IMCC20628]|uniref:class I adenylate-forming enzyme family protein n=1 Tax=Hoeflea sp. IMCC20628 TaxID=1620421 RepID=UPI00063A86AD|nr:AMP-binding protein [Hoeflea sp. IMCC20628]AKI00014.1 acyl-CoA synthetase (AMP-forming)/AMP-acid ligase II [Hoeflea sp. IMCC20628]
MNVAEWLARSGRKYPGHPALFSGAQQIADYRGFAQNAAAIGAGLREHHSVKPGDRVAIFAKNTPAYLEAMFGAWFAGAAIVPINAKLHPKEAAYIIANSCASVVFCTAPLGAELTGALAQPMPVLIDLAGVDFEALRQSQPLAAHVAREGSDMAWLFYTSGTTGRPKGVMISHANMQAMVFSYLADVDAVHASDAALYAAPLSHGAGLYCLQHVLKAARHVVPLSGGFDPDEIFALARSLGDIHMFAAPTMVKRLVASARELGETGEGIRTIVYGGGPMYLADIVEAVEVLGPRFCQIYGQGESPMTITALDRASVADRTHPRWRERLASVGTAQSCVEVRIVDDAGNVMATGETGEILVRGTPVMSGYWRDPDATAAALRDGWLWTGDMGALDADGFLTLKDRSKDVIISGGTNIYPREVEEALLTHPGVREVSVVGVPDAEWGESILAFVVTDLDAPPDAAELDQHCLGSIARFKRPKVYRFVSELPKNNYGKVLKTELRRVFADEQAGS